MKKYIFLLILLFTILSCKEKKVTKIDVSETQETPFVWEGANLYFLLARDGSGVSWWSRKPGVFPTGLGFPCLC